MMFCIIMAVMIIYYKLLLLFIPDIFSFQITPRIQWQWKYFCHFSLTTFSNDLRNNVYLCQPKLKTTLMLILHSFFYNLYYTFFDYNAECCLHLPTCGLLLTNDFHFPVDSSFSFVALFCCCCSLILPYYSYSSSKNYKKILYLDMLHLLLS